MSSFKKQHYVPKFYLRNFASRSKNAINIYNIKKQKHIINGNLVNQCYGNHFYGKDLVIEETLRDIETKSSSIIQECIKNYYIPEYGSQDHIYLMSFITTQHARTDAAITAQNDSIDKMIKHVIEEIDPEEKKNFEKIKIKDVNMPQIMMTAAARTLPYTLDLGIYLIYNESNIDFIVSDSPVIFYNQYCQKYRTSYQDGVALSGFQVIFPLSPKVMMICFDQDIYKSSLSLHKLNKPDDIHSLNKIQIMFAFENIYYSQNNMSIHVDKYFREIKNIPIHERTIVREYPLFVNRKKIQNTVMVQEDVKYNFEISVPGLSIKRKYKKVPLFDRINKIRNQELYRLMNVSVDNERRGLPIEILREQYMKAKKEQIEENTNNVG